MLTIISSFIDESHTNLSITEREEIQKNTKNIVKYFQIPQSNHIISN